MNIIYLSETESTNKYASKVIKESLPAEMTVVNTSYQNGGKGQMGNIWVSEKGKNLLFSVILYPSFLPINRQFYLSKVVSLGICDFLELIIPEVKIKWPNDIYYNNRKIGGVLIENAIVGSSISNTIAGVGINVNQTVFPEDLPNPSSLKNYTFINYNIDELLQEIVKCIEKRYLQLKKKQYRRLNDDYHSKLLSHGSFMTESGLFSGSICGVNDSGELLIEAEDEIVSFQFKEIEFVL